MDEPAILGVAKELSRQQLENATSRYIFSASFCAFLFVMALALARSVWQVAGICASQALRLADHPDSPLRPVHVLALMVLCYAVFIPFVFGLIPPALQRLPLMRHWIVFGFRVDLFSARFQLFLFLGLYLGFPFLFLDFVSAHPALSGSARLVAACWLWILCAALALFPLALAALELRIRNTRETSQYLALDLMRFLKRLGQVGGLGAQDAKGRDRLLYGIRTIAGRIRRIYPRSTEPTGSWAREELARAGENFLSLATWLYFPMQGTVPSLRRAICGYLNIFLTGSLHDLPRNLSADNHAQKGSPHASSGWRRAVAYVGAFAYLGAPPLFILGLAVFRGISVPGAADAPLALLYLVWIACGLVAFAERFSPDARSLFADLLGIIAGRK
jgi:hypothetical protein